MKSDLITQSKDLTNTAQIITIEDTTLKGQNSNYEEVLSTNKDVKTLDVIQEPSNLQSSENAPMRGEFTIRIINALLNMNTRATGKMCPLVIINFGSQRKETQVCVDAGTNPVWLEDGTASFSFNRTDEDTI